ncbi:MAG TPA: hypothetical protein VIK72_13410 [Clostridiaceae bacterium]
MKRTVLTFLFNNGVEKTYVAKTSKDATEEEINKRAEQIETFFTEAINTNIFGNFTIGSQNGTKVIINSSLVTALEIKIQDEIDPQLIRKYKEDNKAK